MSSFRSDDLTSRFSNNYLYAISCTIFLLFATFYIFTMPKRKLAPTEPVKIAERPKKAKKRPRHYSGTANVGPTPVQQNLKKLFDNYRENASNEPDAIGTDGTMKYLNELGVDLESAVVMAIFDLVDAPAMGEINRDGFVDGWQRVSNPSNPCDTIERQAKYISILNQKLQTDPAYFKQVYKSSFKYAKPEGQRAVPADVAFSFWDMFFRDGHGGNDWNSGSTRWMDLWSEFYTTKNNRPVNKDLWNQVIELYIKTREPGGESLDWWTEDGAWPTAIDSYVAFVKEQRQASGMDTS